MNRFKKSKYVIIVFVTVLLVSALLATTYSSTIVTKTIMTYFDFLKRFISLPLYQKLLQ